MGRTAGRPACPGDDRGAGGDRTGDDLRHAVWRLALGWARRIPSPSRRPTGGYVPRAGSSSMFRKVSALALAALILAGASPALAAPDATDCFLEQSGRTMTGACVDAYGNLAVGVRLGNYTAITSYPNYYTPTYTWPTTTYTWPSYTWPTYNACGWWATSAYC